MTDIFCVFVNFMLEGHISPVDFSMHAVTDNVHVFVKTFTATLVHAAQWVTLHNI